MDRQFEINLGGLEKLGFTEEEFLELLSIDFKKAVTGRADRCPKCSRSREDVFFTYFKYENFTFGKDTHGGPADYSFSAKKYKICICGCLYCHDFEEFRTTYDMQKDGPEKIKARLASLEAQKKDLKDKEGITKEK